MQCVIKFEVQFRVLNLKRKFINFAPKKKPHQEGVNKRVIPVIPYSEGRPTNMQYSFFLSKYCNIKINQNGVLYNPLSFLAQRKLLHVWPIVRHLYCYRPRKLQLSEQP
jgi:hypothetical protein